MQNAPDLYLAVHKALRYAMQTTVLRLGNTDVGDTEAMREVLAQLRELLDWLSEHLECEERYVHNALERRRRSATLQDVRADHQAHVRHIAMLRADANAVEGTLSSSLEVSRERAHQLYLSLARFVGENLVHMSFEEFKMNPLLWELFSPEELRCIVGSIVQSKSPEQWARTTRWMFPALNASERFAVLRGARSLAGPDVFDRLLAEAKAWLSAEEYAELAAR